MPTVRAQADDAPSTSGSVPPAPTGPKAGPETAWQRLIAPVGLFSASCMSGFIMIPGLGGGNNGGNGWFGGGGGGGGGGSGGQGGQALYDLAADDKDVSDLTEEEAPQADASSGSKWKDLITPTDDVDAAEGQRSGTNRCVEVVIEGWPEAGALPKKVQGHGHETIAALALRQRHAHPSCCLHGLHMHHAGHLHGAFQTLTVCVLACVGHRASSRTCSASRKATSLITRTLWTTVAG